MKKPFLVVLTFALLFLVSSSLSAGTYFFNPTPSDLYDLVHQKYYTWGIEWDHTSEVITEAVNNAIIHGNKSDPKKRVFLDFEWKDRKLKLTVTDQNTDVVDFDEINERINSKDVLSLNGRGILIMRNYMDRVHFTNIETGTRVVLEKAV